MPSSTTPGSDASSTSTPIAAECNVGEETTPWQGDVVVAAEVVQEPGPEQPGVALVQYPRPDYEGKPWSHWGQGIVSSDGRYFSALGDHQGADGNSFIYEYDPSTMELTRIVDVLDAVPHEPGAWGYGKIHAQMALDECDQILVSTYWGSRRGLTYDNGYEGDLLLRLNPVERSTGVVGVILPEHGVASMATSPDGALLYAEAADPFGQKIGAFVVLDTATGGIVFEDHDPSHGGYRSIAVGPDGTGYITWNDTGLARYDPAENTLTETNIQMPGSILRAVTVPDADGTVFAVTRQPEVFFALEADGTVTELGDARGYTASLALAPDGGRFFYVPGAHGGSAEFGTPLIAVDTASGEDETLVELNPLVEEHLGLTAGGSYNVVMSVDAKTLYIALNAGPIGADDAFGEIVLAIVTLP